MKIYVRLENDGAPILFFQDIGKPPRNGLVECYAHNGQHSEATRAYMRQCKKPETAAQFVACCKLLREWAGI